MDLKEQNRELEDDNKRLENRNDDLENRNDDLENRNKGLLMENLQLTNTRADLEKSFARTYQEFICRMLPLLGFVGPDSNKKNVYTIRYPFDGRELPYSSQNLPSVSPMKLNISRYQQKNDPPVPPYSQNASGDETIKDVTNPKLASSISQSAKDPPIK
jgi:hypothetical protein